MFQPASSTPSLSSSGSLSLEEFKASLSSKQDAAQQALMSVSTIEAVEAIRVQYLGRNGEINQVKKSLKDLSPEIRPQVGDLANTISESLDSAINLKLQGLKQQALIEKIEAERIDVTMPGFYRPQGRRHPLTRITEEITAIFRSMGFDVIDDDVCPEVETEYYNFDALNFPADHPAKDMQDTFYTNVAPHVLLRSQTSNAQIRYMENNPLPIRVVSPGRVYRNEDVSSKKNVLFHQLEGLLVDEHVTVADLKGTLNEFIKHLFGEERPTRFRSSYFPFTEPSMEVDVLFSRPVNGQIKEDWLEILGCGMVDPNVLQNVGIDPERYSGFAFGMGIERLAMLKYNIDDLRHFYTNDTRFLKNG